MTSTTTIPMGMPIMEAYSHAKERLNFFTKQRTDGFNFSLILLGVLTHAIVGVSKELSEKGFFSHYILALILSIGLILTALFFLGLDYRTMSFIGPLHNLLEDYERDISIGKATTTTLIYREERIQRCKYESDSSFLLKNIFFDAFSKLKQVSNAPKFGTLILTTYFFFMLLGALFALIATGIFFSHLIK